MDRSSVDIMLSVLPRKENPRIGHKVPTIKPKKIQEGATVTKLYTHYFRECKSTRVVGEGPQGKKYFLVKLSDKSSPEFCTQESIPMLPGEWEGVNFSSLDLAEGFIYDFAVEFGLKLILDWSHKRKGRQLHFYIDDGFKRNKLTLEDLSGIL